VIRSMAGHQSVGTRRRRRQLHTTWGVHPKLSASAFGPPASLIALTSPDISINDSLNYSFRECQQDGDTNFRGLNENQRVGDNDKRTIPPGYLIAWLEDVNMSQREFADRVGEHPATITNWKRRGIPWSKIASVVTVMGINMDQYLADPEGKNYSAKMLSIGRVQELSSSAQLTYSIPKLDVGGSMGVGKVQPELETIVSTIDVNQNWVRTRLPNVSSPSNLRVITGYGDSMEGTYEDGDILFIDVGYEDIKLDAVYVFSLEGEIFIKRLQRRPDGSLWVISDNKKYDPYPIPTPDRDTLRVIGRVVWAWNGKRL
jgi:phage repressor protein C with HTH and peptisase S24 domain